MVKKLALVALLVASSAHAQFKDGNRLLSDINGTTLTKMNSIGYVTGVADTFQGIVFCMPYSATAGQILDMVKQYLEQNPANRHNAGDRIVTHVLRNAWPCAQSGQSL